MLWLKIPANKFLVLHEMTAPMQNPPETPTTAELESGTVSHICSSHRVFSRDFAD